MIQMGLSGAQCFSVFGRVNIRPPNKLVQSPTFLLDLTHNKKAKFIKTHRKKDHFSMMSMTEFDGTAFIDNEAVLEVFYKNSHKTNIVNTCGSPSTIHSMIPFQKPPHGPYR